MQTKWGEAMEFDYIILDYFFCPAGWARTRWTEAFFKNTLPMLATSNILKPNGSIFLPNLDCVKEFLTAYADILEEHFMWNHVKNPLQNPLYKSTERCQKELLLCPDMLTNATQVLSLNEYSDTPFIIFKRLNRSYEKRSASGTLIKSVKRCRENAAPEDAAPIGLIHQLTGRVLNYKQAILSHGLSETQQLLLQTRLEPLSVEQNTKVESAFSGRGSEDEVLCSKFNVRHTMQIESSFSVVILPYMSSLPYHT